MLCDAATEQVAIMLQAFVPNGFEIRISETDEEVPGFPHAEHYHFRGTMRDSRADGSDAHFTVASYTQDGVRAKLLAVILEKRGFYPLT